MKKTLTTLTALTLAAGLSACGIAPEQDSAPPPSSSSSEVTPEPWTDEATPDEATPDEATPDEAPEPSNEADSMVVGLGETFTWEDGTTARIEAPQSFQKSEWAAGGEGYSNTISFKVTVTNGSDVPLDASFTSPNVTSGEREGDEIFDDEVGGGPTSDILPGRTVTFTVAYGVDDPADIVAEFAPTLDHQAAYWTTDGGEQV